MGSADRNLLFGILALQMDFVTRDQLVAAMHAWVLDKTKTLGALLEEHQALGPAAHYLLTALVEEHVKQHDNDAQASLAALGSDAAIRAGLDRIADVDVQASLSHISRAANDDPNATISFPAPTFRGKRFRIVRPHAEGGLGKVYVAHDEELNREVALKEIKEARANDTESRARFVLEAEITGGLEHPGIVPVYGLGTYADGRPFYAMRFIRGDSLKEAIERFHKSEYDSLELRKLLGRLIAVCQAMQYAHDRGVIHRDLKPGNIMLGKYGETLVVDWGLAKAVGKHEIISEEPTLRPASASGSAETLPGHAIGTPAYMSPEQAAGRLDIVAPASDVYSLGATLYSMLTGKPSIEDRDQAIALKKVCDGLFPRPGKHRPDVDPALEAICLKAMALSPSNRYASPRALAEDLEFWLADKPVSAWAEPLRVKARRWMGTHRTLVAGAAAALIVGVVSLLAATVLLSNANHANEILADKEKKAREHAEDLLKKEEQARLEAKALALRIEFEHYFSKAEERPDLALVGMASLLSKAAPSEAALLRLQIGALRRRTAALKAICPHQANVVAIAWSADGKLALTGSHDNTARLWDTATGKPVGTPLYHQGRVIAAALSADGKTALTGSEDKTARLWDTATRQPIGSSLQHQHDVLAVALSADGKTALTGSRDKTARLWDATTGMALSDPFVHHGWVLAVALNADGTMVLTGSSDWSAQRWDKTTGKPIGDPVPHPGPVSAAALNADGTIALTASENGTALLWPTMLNDKGPPLRRLDYQTLVATVALSADGKTALTASRDKTAQLWETATGKPIGWPLQNQGWPVVMSLSADGTKVLTGSLDKTARLWETPAGWPTPTLLQHPDGVNDVALSADGRIAATACRDHLARVWDTNTGKQITPLPHRDEVTCVSLSADGKIVLTGSLDRTARLWDTTGQPIATLAHPHSVVAAVLSADGKTVLTGCSDQMMRLWHAATGMKIGMPFPHQTEVHALALSADGAKALTCNENNAAQLWATSTRAQIGPPFRRQGVVVAVALNASGGIALTGSEDKTARLWDTATGKPIGPPLLHQAEVRAVALRADGKIALTGSIDKTARLWESATGKPIGPPLLHELNVLGVALSADGKIALTRCGDQTARLWKVPQPIVGDPERIIRWTQVVTGFEVDDLTAVHILDAAAWNERRTRLAKMGGPPDE